MNSINNSIVEYYEWIKNNPVEIKSYFSRNRDGKTGGYHGGMRIDPFLSPFTKVKSK